MKTIALATFLLASAAVVTQAQEGPAIGVVFGDAEQIFHVVENPIPDFDFGFSGVTYQDVDRKRLDIVATDAPDGVGGVLLLRLDYVEDHARGGWPLRIVEAQTIYHPTPGSAPFWIDAIASDETTFDFTRFEYDGKEGHVNGSFSARLCRVLTLDGYPDPDINDCRDMLGSFDLPVLSAG